MKIYTKKGDKGNTSLFGGRRVSKAHLRVDTYGTVDELNSFIGQLHDQVANPDHKSVLRHIQDRLFTIGSHLASDPKKSPILPDLKDEDLEMLEKEMDAMEATLPPLKNFILPGGHPAVSSCHICRTVCRRAERMVVALARRDEVADGILQYLNRLSDYFFMLGRKLSQELGVEELVWKPRG